MTFCLIVSIVCVFEEIQFYTIHVFVMKSKGPVILQASVLQWDGGGGGLAASQVLFLNVFRISGRLLRDIFKFLPGRRNHHLSAET